MMPTTITATQPRRQRQRRKLLRSGWTVGMTTVGSLLLLTVYVWLHHHHMNDAKNYQHVFLSIMADLPSIHSVSNITVSDHSRQTNASKKKNNSQPLQQLPIQNRPINTSHTDAKLQTIPTTKTRPPLVIGYVVTVTSCPPKPLDGFRIVDGAAVLQHSVHMTSVRYHHHYSHPSHSPSNSSTTVTPKYDYQFYAVYHPMAQSCVRPLADLGFQLLQRDIPVPIQDIRGDYLRRYVNESGCCGEREFIKLEAYNFIQHPIVVALDLDALLLQPLDPIFDLMLSSSSSSSSSSSVTQHMNTTNNRQGVSNVEVMWRNRPLPKKINAFYTRDYNMVQGRPGVHVGYQGGFLIIRPNQTVYQEFVNLIRIGNFTYGGGWGGRVGWFYGGLTIQGILPYYYDFLQHGNDSVELNRCVYNHICDTSASREVTTHNGSTPGCTTGEDQCEDCQNQNVENIVSVHYTICGKPWECIPIGYHRIGLCEKLHHEWFRIRSDMEKTLWNQSGYGSTTDFQRDYFYGFCRENESKGYQRIQIPNTNDNNISQSTTSTWKENGTTTHITLIDGVMDKRNNKDIMAKVAASPALEPITVAYVVTVTSCKGFHIIDGAAVLKHSIHLSSIRSGSQGGGTFDYQMYAVYHPVAKSCVGPLANLGYTLLERDVPVPIDEIRGEYLRRYVNESGCCGEREYIKLEAYTLTNHSIVVILDLDALVLQPLDPIFNLMLSPSSSISSLNTRTTTTNSTTNRSKVIANVEVMWPKTPLPKNINAFFTRDYNMIAGRQDVHAGFQGGFLVLRPNRTVYQELTEVVRLGNFTEGGGWGGQVGWFYGGPTIQGILPYYYDFLRHAQDSVELNRCKYNQMGDAPRALVSTSDVVNNETLYCNTGEHDCEDCRIRKIEDIVTVHFTICEKPWECIPPDYHHIDLCEKLHHEWFRIRSDLEKKMWRRSGYGSGEFHKEFFYGFCNSTDPKGYQHVNLPASSNTTPNNVAVGSHRNEGMVTASTPASTPVKVAYVVTVTSCTGFHIVDGASVLKHSIHLTSIRSHGGGKYDYQFYVIYHPNAKSCIKPLADLGFILLERDIPVPLHEIRGEYLRQNVNASGCCGEKEFIKLEAYTLTNHSIVVTLDLDSMVLKPMDSIFDLLLESSPQTNDDNPTKTNTSNTTVGHVVRNVSNPAIMWPNVALPSKINAFFTRDYNMISVVEGRRTPFQGGFLILRPDLKVYHDFLEIIRVGDFIPGLGWGGEVGWFYGGLSIQGILPYYYDVIHGGRQSVELNRCIYNQMCDNPRDPPMSNGTCVTGRQHNDNCEDCRIRNVEDIVSVHFTICLKPWWCMGVGSHWLPICEKLHHEWFRIRSDMEKMWGRSGYGNNDFQKDYFYGFCNKSDPTGYQTVQIPSMSNVT